MPIISIIIPVYNASKTLDRCIQSVLEQSFSNFELLLVDDASIDDSLEICRNYLEKDSRVKVIQLSANLGASNARNIALEQSSGKYVMFADSDDYVAKDWCKYLYECICKHPLSLISSNFYDVFSHQNSIKRLSNKQNTGYLASYYQLFNLGISGFLWNKIFDIKTIQRHNLQFVKGQICGEDVAFIIKYMKYCDSFYCLSEPLYYYVQNNLSLTHKFYENKIEENLQAFAVRLPFIESQYLTQYCDSYFPYLMGLFENIFHPACKKNIYQKLHYNQEVMNSKEFRYCVKHISGKNESPLLLKIVRTHNYYLLWLFQKLYSLKSK